MKLPTDLQVLDAIYNHYYEEFSNYQKGEENGRQSKVYLPIDCKLIATQLGVDSDIIFGRLYNHLNKLHSYENEDKSKVLLFALKVGADYKCVHFPMLSSVLAGLQADYSKFKTTVWLSSIAIVVSLTSLAISIVKMGQ
ncbi:hypothetical protein ALO71_200049 [Pseudomonas amygdali pv. dendropanacis]|uniref:ATPase AAA n=1 Tax=Pseudomonas amygdali pv. dendropanacis TaxID=235272 RepID=A0A0P9S4A5_PSEA0|nr:hypothetical protein [Pseudomonas amygdali]KPX20435.1 hypothetical protein ALO71_200049 [Pseudomonas amygdali pv. dendropanacis]KWS81039.1 hypothetical protein AL051_26255 [Pseudomonas amygdali pv. dendropanacis]